jgi:hypothetical protein
MRLEHSMSLTISLPSDAEAKLWERADAAGQDVAQYVEDLITRELAAPVSIAEAAEPFARAVEAKGGTDEQFLSVVSKAVSAARRERRNGPA